MRVVPVLQGQRMRRRGPDRDQSLQMQVVQIVKIAVLDIAVVGAVVGERRQGWQGSRTIGLPWLYDRLVVRFWNDSLVLC